MKVNGRDHQVETDPATPLLYVLRGEFGLNGAKFGCGLGQCGACTAIVEGEPVYSCLMPLALLEGSRSRRSRGSARPSRPCNAPSSTSRPRNAAIASPG